ncbi:uncharacterized protein DSM5745_04980 [Aspergillus mulundensis]|uniref:Uncharacterized protein n=1 Tax=Aspergillus mulundensis TaxID=1810919 RepID=A0A3D8S543_9EURO|nr:hypothetical protein DSM5745_04980 [Aspergillus mulundensis]RDW81423.1 hypothetical protein DSM5745_04980 [Aspergillus mulundensis]
MSQTANLECLQCRAPPTKTCLANHYVRELPQTVTMSDLFVSGGAAPAAGLDGLNIDHVLAEPIDWDAFQSLADELMDLASMTAKDKAFLGSMMNPIALSDDEDTDGIVKIKPASATNPVVFIDDGDMDVDIKPEPSSPSDHVVFIDDKDTANKPQASTRQPRRLPPVVSVANPRPNPRANPRPIPQPLSIDYQPYKRPSAPAPAPQPPRACGSTPHLAQQLSAAREELTASRAMITEMKKTIAKQDKAQKERVRKLMEAVGVQNLAEQNRQKELEAVRQQLSACRDCYHQERLRTRGAQNTAAYARARALKAEREAARCEEMAVRCEEKSARYEQEWNKMEYQVRALQVQLKIARSERARLAGLLGLSFSKHNSTRVRAFQYNE